MPRPENMRVTFWGTRGSCPTFPAPWEVQEYAHRISISTVEAALGQLAKKLNSETTSEEMRVMLERDPAEFANELNIAKLPIFGGETTCVEVETSDGDILIFDWGSGIRHCAYKLLRERQETELKKLYLFGSHEHLDHRLGLSFATFCFADPPFDIQVFGNKGVLQTLDEHFGFFSETVSEATYHDDPIDFSMMSASIRGVEIRSADDEAPSTEGAPWEVRDLAEPIEIGSTVIIPFKAYHGAIECLGYRIEHGGKVFLFCTDHERLRPEAGSHPAFSREELVKSVGADHRVDEMCRGADLAYFDGQYSREEYYGRKRIGASPAVPRVGWGHGCIEDILDKVRNTGITRALIGHHDPERSWPDQVAMDEELRELSAGKSFQVSLARDGQTIEL